MVIFIEIPTLVVCTALNLSQEKKIHLALQHMERFNFLLMMPNTLITQCLVTIMRKKLRTSGTIISDGYDLRPHLEVDSMELLKSLKYIFSYMHKIIISRTDNNFFIRNNFHISSSSDRKSVV